MASWQGAPLPPVGKRGFEQMYPASDFPCPAYAVLGNHDYQRWPESKVDAELEYARSGRNGGRRNPLDDALALVSLCFSREESTDYVPGAR